MKLFPLVTGFLMLFSLVVYASQSREVQPKFVIPEASTLEVDVFDKDSSTGVKKIQLASHLCTHCKVQRSNCYTGCDNKRNLNGRVRCINRCNANYDCATKCGWHR